MIELIKALERIKAEAVSLADAQVIALEALRAALQDKAGEVREPVAWEATTDAYIKHITDAQYQRFSTEVKRWYKPYKCSSCAEKTAHSYEPAGVLMHWPMPGGGRKLIWSEDDLTAITIGCPPTKIFKKTYSAAHPAPVVPDDVVRYRMIRDGLVYIEPHESGEIYVAGETGVYTKSGDEFDSAIDAIAASQQKGGQHG